MVQYYRPVFLYVMRLTSLAHSKRMNQICKCESNVVAEYDVAQQQLIAIGSVAILALAILCVRAFVCVYNLTPWLQHTRILYLLRVQVHINERFNAVR